MLSPRTTSKLFLLTTVVSCSLLTPLYAEAETDVLFVIDSSGSMSQVTSGKKQIDAAREAVSGALQTVPEGAHVGVRAYAHRVEQTKKEESCRDTELVMPIDALDKTRLAGALNSLAPKGYTPIAYALEQARNDFSSAREAEKVIVLLSDGEETCGGDPAAVIAKLKADGFKVTVHAVGFNVDDKARAQLQAVAVAGGGKYFDAKNGDQLKGALQDATKASFVISKKTEGFGGKSVRGGDGFESAVALTLNEELRLDHHQKKSEYDYFYVDLQPGQELTVNIKTFEKGVAIVGDRVTENMTPYAGFRLHEPNRTEAAQTEIIGGQFKSEERRIAAKEAGRHYLAIGSVYEGMNKDQTQFVARVTTKGDLDSDTDAGDTIAKSLTIDAKRYEKNHLGGPDSADTFSFSAKAGEQYQVLLIPGDKFTQNFTFRMFDEVKRSLAEESAPPSEGIKSKPIAIPEDGKFFLEVKSGGMAGELEQYALELRKVQVEAPVTDTPAPKPQGSPRDG